ncbi:MAG: dihydroorotase [bacterium]
MRENFTIRKGDDFHCHLRRGYILKSVVGFTARAFKRAVIMPNTSPPILTCAQAAEYRKEILSATDGTGFEPLMTIQINDQTSPKIITEAKEAGVTAGKVYPQGVTTNSQNGVTDFKKIYPALQEMQNQDMPLLLHGESPEPGVFCLDGEKEFLPTLLRLAEKFSELKIVLEHITTAKAAEAVLTLDNVAATITVHHLLLTLDDVVGGLICPHNFCKPIAKYPGDREALLAAAVSGNPKFFYGGDSAPHFKKNKECGHGCAGVFNAPVALPLLAQIFEQEGKIRQLTDFVSKFGADFYGLPRNKETVKLVKSDWTVPEEYNGIVPFMAGETLRWQIAD